MCPDCNQNHSSFDGSYQILQKYKIINHIMTYCNVNQFNAKKLYKVRNITNCDQIKRNFKSSAYLAWKNTDYFQEDGEGNRHLAPSSSSINIGRNFKRRRKLHRGSNTSTSDSGQMISDNKIDVTLILSTNRNSTNDIIDNLRVISSDTNIINSARNEIPASINNRINIGEIFPAPRIIRDLFDLYTIYLTNQ